jgi:hypothetical protein
MNFNFDKYVTTYHPHWQMNRIQFMINKFGKDYFREKTILELAPFNGFIGNYFQQELGAIVTGVEGRSQNVENIKKEYPHLNILTDNLDTANWIYGSYDIILNLGLFYHLEYHHESHLLNCINHCNIMFFESVIWDSDDSELYFYTEYGDDQSLSFTGGTPTTHYVESIFNKTSCNYVKYSDPELNGDGHIYDWEDKNSKIFNRMTRRFWITQQ